MTFSTGLPCMHPTVSPLHANPCRLGARPGSCFRCRVQHGDPPKWTRRWLEFVSSSNLPHYHHLPCHPRLPCLPHLPRHPRLSRHTHQSTHSHWRISARSLCPSSLPQQPCACFIRHCHVTTRDVVAPFDPSSPIPYDAFATPAHNDLDLSSWPFPTFLIHFLFAQTFTSPPISSLSSHFWGPFSSISDGCFPSIAAGTAK